MSRLGDKKTDGEEQEYIRDNGNNGTGDTMVHANVEDTVRR